MNIEQVMPASLDCERGILGAILLDNAAYDQAASKISAEAFSLDSHRRIFLRMQELFEDGKPIDFNTLTEQLGRHGEIESVGGVVYVTSLADGIPRVKNISHYCEIVLDKFISRQMIHVANAAIASAYEQSDSGKRTLEYFVDSLLNLQANGVKEFAVTPKEFSDQVLANMAAMREHHSRLVGFSLGMESIDHRTTGVRKKELCVIGGRPGQGKTSWALQIAIHNCVRGLPVAFFSLEMDKESLLQRVYSCHGDIEFTKLRTPFLMTDVDGYGLVRVKEKVDEWPLYIDDDSSGENGLTLPELCSRIRLLKRQKGVELFIIDYLQLIGSVGKDQREKIMRIVRRLRRLAKSENIAIILLSQMPRPKDHGVQKKPTMFDLLESGEIEQAAHLILMPWWPVDGDGNYVQEKVIVIAKQRNGEVWDEPVYYLGKYQRYEPR